mgnify:CR=1 FL=1
MKYKINDIIKHKKAYYYYIISNINKNKVVLNRVYYKNNKWNLDYKTNEFNAIDNILPITSLKYFTKNI